MIQGFIDSTPLKVHRLVTLAPWVEGGKSGLQCVYDKRPREMISKIGFYRNDIPVYHYRPFYMDMFKEDKDEAMKISLSPKEFRVDVSCICSCTN